VKDKADSTATPFLPSSLCCREVYQQAGGEGLQG